LMGPSQRPVSKGTDWEEFQAGLASGENEESMSFTSSNGNFNDVIRPDLVFRPGLPFWKLGARRRPRRRRRIKNGRRQAAVRAHFAATAYLEGRVSSLAAAAEVTGSNVPYVQALVALLKSEDTSLLKSVLAGEMPVLVAARLVKRRATLIAAYRSATPTDHVEFAKAVGPSELFDTLVIPAL